MNLRNATELVHERTVDVGFARTIEESKARPGWDYKEWSRLGLPLSPQCSCCETRGQIFYMFVDEQQRFFCKECADGK